jgi:hypothetical protein
VGPGFSKVAAEKPRSERTEPGGNLGVFSRSSGILGRVGMRMVDPIEERT